MKPLLQARPEGIYCPAGDFYIDPRRPVPRAIVTHAHSDHARRGHGHYWTSRSGASLVRQRVGPHVRLTALDFGESLALGEVEVSLHPAGHILGSAQVRVAHAGEVWVVSGDYKLTPDATCERFEPVPCDVFVSECTFGLPIYQWPEPKAVATEINAWWRQNQAEGRTSMLYAYALGKAQRVLSLLDAALGPIGVHGAVAPFNALYQEAGVALPGTSQVNAETLPDLKGQGLVIAPASVQNSAWERKLGPLSRARASGWMTVRGQRRRSALDRGFVLSDHGDWPGLLQAIRATGAPRIYLQHGAGEPLARYLRENLKREAALLEIDAHEARPA